MSEIVTTGPVAYYVLLDTQLNADMFEEVTKFYKPCQIVTIKVEDWVKLPEEEKQKASLFIR